jgi:hypothetical protein
LLQLILSGNAPGDESGEVESKRLGPNEVKEIARLEPRILEVFGSDRPIFISITQAVMRETIAKKEPVKCEMVSYERGPT